MICQISTYIMAIYESPDGGQTIFERESNSDERRMISKGRQSWNWYLRKDWDYLAAKYPAIQEKLEELKTLEALCNTSE